MENVEKLTTECSIQKPTDEPKVLAVWPNREVRDYQPFDGSDDDVEPDRHWLDWSLELGHELLEIYVEEKPDSFQVIVTEGCHCSSQSDTDCYENLPEDDMEVTITTEIDPGFSLSLCWHHFAEQFPAFSDAMLKERPDLKAQTEKITQKREYVAKQDS
jgi:hypothetical protein